MNILFTQTPLIYFIQSFWRDEAFSYLLAKLPLLDILSLTAKDFSPPFYYLLLHYWQLIFGPSEISIRSLSLIFYWVVVYIAFLFMRSIFKISEKRSLLYLVLFLCNPILVYYAFESRMYIMFAALALTSYYAFYKRNYRLYCIATVLGLYTHYFMIFVLLTQFLFSILEKTHIKERIKILLISGSLFVPWVFYTLLNKMVTQESFWIKKPNIGDIFYLPAVLLTGYEKDFGFLKYSYGLLFSLLFITATIGISLLLAMKHIKKKQSILLYYLLLWAFLPATIVFIFSWVKPLYLPRYLILSSPGVILFFIFLVEHMHKNMKVVLVAVMLLLMLSYQRLEIKNRTKTNFSKTIHEIKTLAKPEDIIFVTSELDYHVAQYYFGVDKVYIYNKPYEEIPNYVGKVLIPESAVTYTLPVYPARAFILDSYGNYSIKSSN